MDAAKVSKSIQAFQLEQDADQRWKLDTQRTSLAKRQLLQPSWYISNRVISKIFKLGAVRWNLRTLLSLEMLEWCNTDSGPPVQQPARPNGAGLSGEEARWPVLQSSHSLWLHLPQSLPSAAEPRGHLVYNVSVGHHRNQLKKWACKQGKSNRRASTSRCFQRI